MVLLGAIAAGCAQPEDAFVGSYAGTYSCAGSWSDGTPYTEGPAPQTIAIEQYSDGNVFWAGAGCTIHLDVLGFTRAEVVATVCDVILPTGERVQATYESGVLDLSDPYLDVRYSVSIVFWDRGLSLTSSCDFGGRRLE
jgi:hypothetical protein